MAISNRSTSDGTIDVSEGAQRAIQNAADILRPFKSEPRVASLLTKLNAIASPEDFGSDDDSIVKAMEECEKIAKSDPNEVAESMRKRAGEARQDLERAYLRKSSPAGSTVWEAAARAAGRAA